MSVRGVASFVVLSAVMSIAGAAHGAFSADLYFGDAAGNRLGGPTNVLEVQSTQAVVELVLWDNQVYGGAGEDFIQWVHLNFSASDVAALDPIAHWTWDPALVAELKADGGVGAPGAIGKQDDDPTALWRPASPVRIGSLSIPTPPHSPTGNNDYLLSLRGGDPNPNDPKVTVIWADMFHPAAESLGNMTLQDLTIRVAPEPATLALLGVGAAASLARRKRR